MKKLVKSGVYLILSLAVCVMYFIAGWEWVVAIVFSILVSLALFYLLDWADS